MAKTEKDYQDEIKDLKRKLAKSETALKVAEATKPKGTKPTVEVDGKHYQVLAGHRTAQRVLTREEVAQDRKLCAELVASGSGILQQVNI